MSPLIRPVMKRVPAPVFGILLFTVGLLLYFVDILRCSYTLVLEKLGSRLHGLYIPDYVNMIGVYWASISQMDSVFSAFRAELPLAGFSLENPDSDGCNCILRGKWYCEELTSLSFQL